MVSDSSEPSYYEIALTNRQVLVSFVVLLGSVLVAFAMGVWVGRMEPAAPPATATVRAPEPEVENGELANLQEFRFPSDEPRDELRKPDLSQLRGGSAGEAGAGGALGRPEERAAADRGPVDGAPADGAATAPADRRAADTTLAQDVGSDPRPSPPVSAPPPRQQAPPPSTAPPPARTAAAAEAGESEPAEGFIIQVFSTRDEPQAKKLAARLRQGGHKAFLSPVEVGGQTMYRVRIGPFARRAPAEKAAAEIARDFKLETWITAASN